MSNAEPIVSNISDAIKWMKKEIEQQQAVFDASKLKAFAYLPYFISFALLIYVIPFGSCFVGAVIIGAVVASVWNWGAGFVFGIFSFFGLSFAFIHLVDIDAPMDSSRTLKKLVPLLADLEKLYQYDPSMDVGFQLDGRGEFDETVLKAMMKKRKQEIMQQAQNH